MEAFESIEETKFPQEHDFNRPIAIILDDLNEKEINDSRVQAMFERSRHNNIPTINISQDYYELPKKSVRFTSNIYHIFKPNNFRDVQNLFQDEESTVLALDEFRYLTSTC